MKKYHGEADNETPVSDHVPRSWMVMNSSRVPTAAVAFHLCLVFLAHIDLGWAIASPIVYA